MGWRSKICAPWSRFGISAFSATPRDILVAAAAALGSQRPDGSPRRIRVIGVIRGSMPPAVQQAVESVEDVKTAKVNLVWEPAWSKDRMSDAALLQLGLL